MNNTVEAKPPNDESDWQAIDIYLFSNGQQYSPPRKYHLRSDELNWWDATLNKLAKSMYGLQHPYILLYTTDGHKIESPLELKDGMAYVAVEPSDTFVDAGYDKYLIRATRSWEKRQAKKANPVDVTDSPKQGCNHNQPCCLCPEKEEIVTVESERSVLVATEIPTLREPDETNKDSVLGRTGQNDLQAGAFDQRTGEYINEPAERGRVNDNGTSVDEKSPRSGEQGHPGQTVDQRHSPRESDRLPGEYGRTLVKQGIMPVEYGRIPVDERLPPDEYTRTPAEKKRTSGERGRLPGEQARIQNEYEHTPIKQNRNLGDYENNTVDQGTPNEYGRSPAELVRTSGELGRTSVDQVRAPNKYGRLPGEQVRSLGKSGYPPGEQGRTPVEYSRPADDQIRSLGESGNLSGEQGGTHGEYRHPRVDDQVHTLSESVYPPGEKGGTQSEYEHLPDEQRRSLGNSKYLPGKQGSTPGEYQRPPGGQGRVSGEYERTPFEQGHTPSDNRRTPGEQDRAQGEYDYTSVDHRRAQSDYERSPSEQVRTSGEFGRPPVNQRRTPDESGRQQNEQVRTSGEFSRTSSGYGRSHGEQVRSLGERGNAQDEQGGIPGENRRTSGGQSRTSGEYRRLSGDQIHSIGENGRTQAVGEQGAQGSTPSAYKRPPGGQSRASGIYGPGVQSRISGEHGCTPVDKGRPPGKQGRTSGEYKRTSSDRGRTPGGQGRISGEYSRTPVDQGGRTQSEYGRSQCHQGRELGRTSGEYGRNYGEQERIPGTNERTLGENGRIPGENRRTPGENGRTSGNYVRKSCERGRISGEHTRTSGGNRRSLDDYRTSNEQKRVSSEQGRTPSERTRTLDARGRTFGAQDHIPGQYERSPGNLETNQPVNLSDYYPSPEESGTKVRDLPEVILTDIIEGGGICTGEDLCRSNEPGPRSGKQEDWLEEWGSRVSGIGGRVADIGSRVGEQGGKTVDYGGRLGDPGGKLGNLDNRMGEVITNTGSGYGGRLGEQPEKETEYVTIPGGQDTVAELDGEQEDYRANNGTRGEPEARRGDLVNRLTDHGARLSDGGANGATGFSYVTETQQQIRKSSMTSSAPKNGPATDNKRRCSGAAHTSFRRPSVSPVPPASQRRSEDKKTVRNSRDESKKIGLKPPARSSNEAAATNVVGKQKNVPKYPSKRFTPPAIPLPATSFEQTVIKGKATSLTRIVSNYKNFRTDSAAVENINCDKEITVLSTNLFRNQESEITSVKIDLGSKPVLGCIRGSEESQPEIIHRQQSATAIFINKEVQTCTKNHFTEEMHGERYGGSNSRHITRTSSKLKMIRPASGPRLNLVAGDATPDENYIAIINKGDVVNLKLNIEVRNGDTPLNLNHKPVKKSSSLTNITRAEIGSQISIDEDLVVQSKSLQSLLNSEFRGTGFEGRPKVVVVQCACCAMRTNNAPRSDTMPSESKKYFVLKPSSQQINAAVEKCDCNPALKQISDQRVHQQVKKQSTSLPLNKTFSSTSIEAVTVREASLPLPRREVALFMATTNSICQNDVGRIESPGSRPRVSITEDQIPRCNSVRRSASQMSMHTDHVASRHSKSNSRTCQNCSDSFTQTEWCSVLLEARRHEDGRYSFHLPPLQVLRYHSTC